jgi:hypothetical protein
MLNLLLIALLSPFKAENYKIVRKFVVVLVVLKDFWGINPKSWLEL